MERNWQASIKRLPALNDRGTCCDQLRNTNWRAATSLTSSEANNRPRRGPSDPCTHSPRNAMQILQGIAVSPGVAIGEALVLGREGFRIPRRFVARNAVEHELQRWEQAAGTVTHELAQNRDQVAEKLGDHYGAIFSAQLQMLADPQLSEKIVSLIRGRHYSSEYAVSQTLKGYAKVLQSLSNQYIAERSNDVLDIERLLLRELLGCGHEVLSNLQSPAIVLAHNLTPGETSRLDPEFVLGFVSEIGGPGGHTAIVAEAMGIPAVVGTGHFLADITAGDTVVVDGDTGQIIIQPDDESLTRFRCRIEERKATISHLSSLADLPAVTKCGQSIALMANIEFPYEAEAGIEQGADGIGLYRTEFLYLGTRHEPSEEDHYQAYARVLQAMSGRPVVIRTLDLGADKMGSVRQSADERNPFLGLRSVRLSLRNLPLFRTQLRAALRASALGDLRIMFPLISTLDELRRAKAFLADIMEDLDEEGQAFDRDVPVGMMVEVPATIVVLERFAKEVDFFSIGTNDLVQYTLAVDRGNKEVASLYNNSDPAVLRLLKMALDVAEQCKVPTSLCGQMSSSPKYTMLLLGLGLRSLSVPPKSISQIKAVCRAVTLEQCQNVATRALELDTAADVRNFLKEELRRAVPSVTDSTVGLDTSLTEQLSS